MASPRRLLPLLLALALLVAAGCGGAREEAAPPPATRTSEVRQPPVRVVATTPLLADLARNVGGRAVRVTELLPPGADVREYQPGASDVAALGQADLVLKSGLGLDDWVDDAVARTRVRPAVLDVGSKVPVKLAAPRDPAQDPGAGAPPGDETATTTTTTTTPAEDEEPSAFDPRWFQDPVDGEAAASAIRDELAEVAPAWAAEVRGESDRYTRSLRRLTAEQLRCFAGVPDTRRKLVSDRPVFGYVAGRFHVEVLGSLMPGEDATQPVPGLREVLQEMRQEGVRTVFTQGSLPPRLSRTLARVVGRTDRYRLWADGLGPERSPAATYLGMLRANADRLVRGFTGGARGCG